MLGGMLDGMVWQQSLKSTYCTVRRIVRRVDGDGGL